MIAKAILLFVVGSLLSLVALSLLAYFFFAFAQKKQNAD